MARVLLVQGANMEYLGLRQPEFYGTTTTSQLDQMCSQWAADSGLTLNMLYSNIEGDVIKHLLDAGRSGFDGLIMNPAGFLYSGNALADTILAVDRPYIEVHMTNIEARNKHSVLAHVATGMVTGLGVQSYRIAIHAMARMLSDSAS